ncbi:hemerythrin domain-containing protein [Ideonella sp. DXS29W]|uniref:Hemerythrin domain-containing protein n=1 Tax=Ideonella lacteola TaxID=2984193 RepID=A0ABU9BHM7_9BURK
MPHHPHSRASTAARSHIIELLQDDHRRLKRAYREFQRLDADRDGSLCESIVRRTLQEMRVHAQLEDELIYPLMRPIVSDPERVDEAEVEHEVMTLLIAQLEHANAADDKFSARFAVLCEYLLHHIKEEEGELFPQLKRATLDWESVCDEFTGRREALLAAEARDPLSTMPDAPPTDETGLLLSSHRPAHHPARYPAHESGSITSRKI